MGWWHAFWYGAGLGQYALRALPSPTPSMNCKWAYKSSAKRALSSRCFVVIYRSCNRIFWMSAVVVVFLMAEKVGKVRRGLRTLNKFGGRKGGGEIALGFSLLLCYAQICHVFAYYPSLPLTSFSSRSLSLKAVSRGNGTTPDFHCFSYRMPYGPTTQVWAQDCAVVQR